MAAAAKLLIDIAANVAGLKKDFGEANKVIQGFGDGISKVGNLIKGAMAAFAVHQVIAFGERIAEDVAAMADMAENLKLTVDEFQAFNNAAYIAGQSTEAVSTALGKFNVFIGKATEGSKEQIETLQRLGVKILDVNGKLRPQADLLQEVAQNIIAIEDPAKRAAAEVAVFGKSGQSVSAILEQWAKGQEALNKELEEMGLRLAPEVVKQLDAIADKTAAAQKRIDILLAPGIAKAKSWVVESFERMLINLDALAAHEGLIDTIAAILRLLGSDRTGASAPSQFNINETTNALAEMDKALAKLQARREQALLGNQGLFGGVLKDLEAEIAAKRAARDALAAGSVRTARDEEGSPLVLKPIEVKGGASNPAIAGAAGVDKYAEALRKLQDELKATAEGQEILESTTGKPTKALEREARAGIDAAKRLSGFLKDIPAGVDTSKLKELNDELTKALTKYDDTRQALQTGAAVSAKYGDGQKELADTLFYLDLALSKNAIGQAEYKQAVEDATKAAEQQRLVHEGLEEGLGGVAAGFAHAANAMTDSQSSFKLGEQIFTDSFRLMSDSIREFVETGTLDFRKLAQSFASMLASMAAQLAAQALLKALLGGGKTGIDAEIADWSTYGSGGGITGFFGKLLGGFLSGGMKASGGDVIPNRLYTVGERGPEAFVPSGAAMSAAYTIGAHGPEPFVPPVPGTIVPNIHGERGPEAFVPSGAAMSAAYTIGAHGPEPFVPPVPGTIVPNIHGERGPEAFVPSGAAMSAAYTIGAHGPEPFVPNILEAERDSGLLAALRERFPLLSGGFRATGGDVMAGRVYTVGEAGPERFIPSVPGTIVPAGAAQAGDVTVNVAMGGRNKTDPKTTLEFARKVKAAVLDTIQNEQRPGGILYARGA